MNVLQIIPKLELGGAERGVVDFAKYLVNHGHKAVVISNGGRLLEELQKVGAKHYQLPVHRKSLLSVIHCARAISHIILSEDIDIVHARSRVPAWSSYFATRALPCEFIITAHGYYSIHFLSRVASYGKFIICPGKVIATHMIEDFGCPSSKVRIIHRSVDLEKFKYLPYSQRSRDKFIISYIGRISPIKGIEYLLQAMKKVARNFPFVKLWIIGSPSPGRESYLENLKVLTRRLSLDRFVEFLGTRGDVHILLDQIHINVLPAVIPEAFPRAVIESQAKGTCVIASDIGGIREIIKDNYNGLLVPPKDVDSLSSALVKLIRQPALAEEICKNAYREVVEKFGVEIMCQKTLDVYREAKSIKRILVIKVSSLGDVILCIPSLRAIKQHFPDYEVSLLVAEKYSLLFKDSPYIDKIIVCNIGDIRSFRKVWELSERLRRESFDISIDIQNTHYTHLLAFLAGVPQRYGFKRKWACFLTQSVDLPSEDVDPVESQEYLLLALNIKMEDKNPTLVLSPEDIKRGQQILKSHSSIPFSRMIGLNLGGSPKWQTKSWKKNTLIQLIGALSKKGYVFVLTGEIHHASLASFLENSFGNKVINLCAQTTITELASVIYNLRAYITVDSAPLHMSVALGKPTFAFFGPTRAEKHSLKRKNLFIFRKEGLKCVGCYKKKCRTLACMEWDIKTVVSKIIKGINESSSNTITS